MSQNVSQKTLKNVNQNEDIALKTMKSIDIMSFERFHDNPAGITEK